MANRDKANVCFWPIADMCYMSALLLPHLSWARRTPAGLFFHSLLHFAFSEHVHSDVKLRPRGWTAAQPIVKFCDLITSQMRSRLYSSKVRECCDGPTAQCARIEGLIAPLTLDHELSACAAIENAMKNAEIHRQEIGGKWFESLRLPGDPTCMSPFGPKRTSAAAFNLPIRTCKMPCPGPRGGQ
jgi:hypothetical protein